MPTSLPAQAEVAVIGGSGFYELGGAVDVLELDTPWGPPSSPVAIGEVDGGRVAFLSRHGVGHRLPPHAVDHRANLWALRAAGVRAVVASFACGSLVPHLGPGQLVVPDQLIDRTSGRADTIHDTFRDGPQHAPFADPYDASAREAALAAGAALEMPVHDGGTVVVINGPRFATRAESRWYRSMGADLINMTQYPEAVLARELGVRYVAVGLVTDFDAGLDERPDVAPVDQETVFEVFAQNLPRLRSVVLAAAASLA
jgi:5'-methylthioadenosine phosphorylase